MKNMRKKIGIIIGFLSPVVMFCVFEWFTGNLLEIEWIYRILNLMLFFLIYFMVFSFTNSMRAGFTVLNGIFTVWAAAEYYVMEFRGRPIMIWDILAFRTAMTVADAYQYDLTPRIIIGIGIIIIWTGLIWMFPAKLPSRKAVRAAAAFLSAGGMGIFLLVFFQYGISALGMEINMWLPSWSYGQYGYLLSTLRMIDYLSVDSPEGYSLETVQKIEQEIQTGEEEDTPIWDGGEDIVPVNIICIMNESYSDLRVIGDFSTDIPFMSFYDSLEENCIKGELYMPVFGSMTSNSEFEFLTGNSIAFTPSGSVPYQIYMRNPSWGLASMLKEQGYRTVAVHPNEKTNWNRDEAYKSLQFDEFYGIEFFRDSPTIRGYVSDLGDYEKIISLTEGKEEGQPLFIFNVTMQNHGGYETDYESTVHLTEIEGMEMTEQYLSLIRESDQALAFLLGYYEQIDEPTMIVFFGDHQPAVEEEFYEAVYQCALDELSQEDYVRRYITPFFIWTNYETKSMTKERMSTQFLACAVLERANLKWSEFFSFLRQMYRQTPVVHISGYYTSQWKWENWRGWEEKREYPMFHQFDLLQYHNLFARNRLDRIFTIDGG